VHLSRALAGRGIGVLRFDFTGLGESEGDFADTDFSSDVADLVAAARFLGAEREAPAILVGHSLGGAAVLKAASHIRGVRAVVTLGAPAEAAHVLKHVQDSLEEIEMRGQATVTLGGRPFPISSGFVRDLRQTSMEEAIANLGRPLLVFHSPVDTVVGIENAARIFGLARHPKSFVSLDRADHLILDERDARYAAEVLAAWASRYVGRAPAPEAGSGSRLASPDAVMARIGRESYRTKVSAGTHSLTADEPAASGGGDLGPTPYDLLASALAACTAMTLRMYADRKGWDLAEAVVEVEHNRDHAADCDACPKLDARIDRFERHIRVTGALNPSQIDRLADIARRCPVGRTLERGARLNTLIDDPPESR